MSPLPPLRWRPSRGDDPALDLAREEVLLAGPGPTPHLLTWSWERPVLVMGFGQRQEGLDLGFCSREGIAVLRRCSGGTGVLYRGDLGLSLVLPPDHPWASGIRLLYDRFVGAIQGALSGMGFPVGRPPAPPPRSGPRSPICFEDRLAETLLSGGRKVLGCAQARRASGVLVHGTLLLSENNSLYEGVFQIPGERVRRALGPLPGGPHDPAKVARTLAVALAEALGSSLAEGELEAGVEGQARVLARDRNLAEGRYPGGRVRG